MKSKHVVTYRGAGVWRDCEGELYENGTTAEFETEGTEEQFLEKRGDLAFMITYGQMTISTVSVENTPPVTPPVAPPVAPSVTQEPPKPIVK